MSVSVEDCIKGLKQVWCLKGNSQDGFQLKQGYAKGAYCHNCYTALRNGHDEVARGFGSENGWNLLWGSDACG